MGRLQQVFMTFPRPLEELLLVTSCLDDDGVHGEDFPHLPFLFLLLAVPGLAIIGRGTHGGESLERLLLDAGHEIFLIHN